MPSEQDLFSVQRKCLRLMGHRDCEDEKSHKATPRWHIYKHYCVLLLVISAWWPFVDYVVYHIDDMALATEGLNIILTNMLTSLKITTFLLHKRKFIDLMEQLQQMQKELKDPLAQQRLEAANLTATRFTKLYYNSVCLTGMYFVISPIVAILWAALRGKPLLLTLPMPSRFSFDYGSTPGYELAYAYISGITLIVVMYAAAVDGFFVTFTTLLSGHFEVLQHFMETNPFDQPKPAPAKSITNYTRYHLLLLSIVDRVREVYRPIVFGQFLMSSLQLCLIVYQLMKHIGLLMKMASYGSYLCSILLQLFIYCYGGELLKHAALSVGTSVQLSNWYNLQPTEARKFLFILHRSQRPIIIQGGFYDASLANFMTILRAAMSYIAIIQSIE